VAVIVVCGDTNVESTAPVIAPFRSTVGFTPNLFNWGGALTVPAVSDKGDVRQNKQALEEAYELGQRLGNTSK
jgi:hypothetical protein